jgi:hypothetical protein
MWHCPHCGAPQAESARCWVCRRSSTTCSTCRNFRGSLAADVGFCSLDRQRRPLTGRELRGCWESRPAAPEVAPNRSHIVPRPGHVPVREFVPLDEVAAFVVGAPSPTEAPDLAAATPAVVRVEGTEAPTSLFGDQPA